MNQLHRKGAGMLLLTGILLALVFFVKPKGGPERLTYHEFWKMAQAGEIERVVMGGPDWEAVAKDGREWITADPRAADGKERLLQLDIDVKEKENTLPGLGLIAILAAAFLFARGRGGGTAGLRQYAAVPGEEKKPAVTFADVAAGEETLTSMRDLVDFLREPERFARYGARIPRGVMLYGPPGTGKTLLARALAGEAGTPFFAMSGADFVQVYVGVGASRVRELFRKARKAGRGVIFIDEIDAIGKRRDSGNDEREQTLNALLTEMSGFSSGEGILVLAATNRLDTLDPALLREGRFDRRIEVGLPDREQREKILRVHAGKKPLSPDVSLKDWAQRTALFSGAQLETLLNEAGIRAARRGSARVENRDVEQAFCGVTVGDACPRQMTEEEKRITAWHEMGHALATRCFLPESRLTRVTVIPSSRGAAGYSMSVPPDRLLHTRSEMLGMICAALGGRAAEELLLGRDNVTTGAGSDLKRAREIAAAMAGEYAMGETGEEGQDQKTILNEAMEKTRQCLKERFSLLKSAAETLLEKETLGEEDMRRLLG